MQRSNSLLFLVVIPTAVVLLNAWNIFSLFRGRWSKRIRGVKPQRNGNGKHLHNETTTHAISLLLSFPNSGTSYTIVNVEKLTNTSAATNYDAEVPASDCCPMVIDVEGNDSGSSSFTSNGNSSNHHPSHLTEAAPLIHHPRSRLPRLPETILTKTHCDTVASTFEDFARSCFTVVYNSNSPGNETRVEYSKHLSVANFVHLVRSPMDNLVSRKHMAARHAARSGTLEEEEVELFLNDTAESFQAWCSRFDHRHLPIILHQNRSGPLRHWLQEESRVVIPCLSDLYWYVTWHNWALQLTADKDTLVLYYEDYREDYNGTVNRLLNFLGLSAVGDPLEFEMSKTYSYYTDEQIEAIRRFVETFATESSWNLLRRYFE